MKKHSPPYLILRQERKLRGWSQNDLAEKLHCDPKTVGRWERGEAFPGPTLVQELIKLFHKNADELGLIPGENRNQHYQRDMPQALTPSPLSRIEGIQIVSSLDIVASQENAYVSSNVVYSKKAPNIPVHEYWEDTSYIDHFYGREKELALLQTWLSMASCRIIALLGIGGSGKTTIARKFAEQIKMNYEHVFWYSLRNAPPIESFLEHCLIFLYEPQHVQQPEQIEDRISLLITVLSEQRCLLILDNVESVMRSGQHMGQYLVGYEDYGKLFQRIGEARHSSNLILTSREKPREIAHAEGHNAAVRSLTLSGLEISAGQQLLQDKDLSGTHDAWQALIHLYAGNPLALKVVSGYIYDLFAGDIAKFLGEGKAVFGDIRALLEQQFQRLSALEQDLMIWLAIEREAVTLDDLREDMIYSISKGLLLEAANSLCRRSMLEHGPENRFTLQPAIMEYIVEYLVELTCTQIESDDITRIGTYALMKTRTSDYVRESQARLILFPIADRLLTIYGLVGSRQKLKAILAQLRHTQLPENNFAASNILNLLVHLQDDLRGLDCSGLTVRQAYLQGVDLPAANFAHAKLIDCVFTNTFTCILCLAVSSSGSLLAAGTTTGEVRVWRTLDASPVLVCNEHDEEIRSVAFSPDEQLLVSASEDHTLRIWDVRSGRCLHTLRSHTDFVRTVAFSPDGRFLASGSEDHTIRLWDSTSGVMLHVFEGHSERVRTLAFHQHRPILATGSGDHTVRLWNYITGELIAIYSKHTRAVMTIAFHPNNDLLATGSDDCTIHLWDTTTHELLTILQGHDECIRTITFSTDGCYLASGSDDNTIRLWNTATYQFINLFRGHSSRIWSLVFVPNSTLLISASEDESLRWWETRSGHTLRVLHGYINLIKSIAFHPSGKILASGGDDKMISLWNIEHGHRLKQLRGHTHRVRSIAFSPDGSIVASGSEDETVKLWDIRTGYCLKTLRGHTHLIRAIAFDKTGRWLVSGSHDLTLRLWDVRTGKNVNVVHETTGLIWAIAFHPAGQLVASGGDDPAIRLWDIHTGILIRTLKGHTHRVWSTVFSNDGELLASCGDDLTIRLWNVATGECLRILQGHEGWVRSLAFSPDGTCLASGSHDLTIRLWDISTGNCEKILQGHEGWIWSVTFHPDNQMLASGSDDGTTRLWDLAQGENIRTFRRERPYEGTDITGTLGLSQAQKDALHTLGAIEE